MRTIGETSGVLPAYNADLTGAGWQELNENMSQVLRCFQAAARAGLGIDDARVENSAS